MLTAARAPDKINCEREELMATQQEVSPVRAIFGGDVDPYPFYAAMRGGRRELQIGPVPIWMLSRYDEVLSAFKRPELFSSIAFRETRSADDVPGSRRRRRWRSCAT